MLSRLSRVMDCLAVALASPRDSAPMAWATMAKVPVVTAIMVTLITMTSCREMPTAEMASAPSFPTM